MTGHLRKRTGREAQEEFESLQRRATARLLRVAAPYRRQAPASSLLDELDARSRKRIAVEHPALVVCEEHEDRLAHIVDLSPDGLRLRFPARAHLVGALLIDSPAFAGFIVANVKWQSGAEAGLAFDHAWTQKLAASTQLEPTSSVRQRKISVEA